MFASLVTKVMEGPGGMLPERYFRSVWALKISRTPGAHVDALRPPPVDPPFSWVARVEELSATKLPSCLENQFLPV